MTLQRKFFMCMRSACIVRVCASRIGTLRARLCMRAQVRHADVCVCACMGACVRIANELIMLTAGTIAFNLAVDSQGCARTHGLASHRPG